jgi:hypothetical protein
LKNDTLCSLLSCKCNQNHHCYGYAPSAWGIAISQKGNCTE